MLGRDGVDLAHSLARRREPHLMAAREALARGQRVVDLQIAVSAATLAATEPLVAKLVRLARQGSLLAAVPSPEVVAFRRWWVDQIDLHIAGGKPTACPFPALPVSVG